MHVTSTILHIGARSLLLPLILAACAAPAAPTTPAPAPTYTPAPIAVTPEMETPATRAPEPAATGTATRPTPEPQPVENMSLTVAYIGLDGNLWLTETSGSTPRQMTSDAAQPETGGDIISYSFPMISSDGRFIAVRRDAGVPISEGVRYQFGLWVYDTDTGESRPVYEDPDSPPAGFDWKPGTHLLAYGIGADPNYFIARGKPDAALSTGIYAADLDSGESSLLVAPVKGYSLILPAWSPDGRFLSFDELIYMEGRGPFAYYDFEARQVIAWDEPLGNYDWSPDSSQIAYDRLSYTATGTERIFTRPRLDGDEEQVSPEPDQGYAFYPVFSPDGRQIAYLDQSRRPGEHPAHPGHTRPCQTASRASWEAMSRSGTSNGPQTAGRWCSAPARTTPRRCTATTC